MLYSLKGCKYVFAATNQVNDVLKPDTLEKQKESDQIKKNVNLKPWPMNITEVKQKQHDYGHHTKGITNTASTSERQWRAAPMPQFLSHLSIKLRVWSKQLEEGPFKRKPHTQNGVSHMASKKVWLESSLYKYRGNPVSFPCKTGLHSIGKENQDRDHDSELLLQLPTSTGCFSRALAFSDGCCSTHNSILISFSALKKTYFIYIPNLF